MSKVKLEVGMRMKCEMYGEGKVKNINHESERPIYVTFPSGSSNIYSLDGRLFQVVNPTLKLLNIPFAEGMEVECDIYGSGVVTKVHENIMYQKVQVAFSGKLDQYYTEDGRINSSANQTLFPKYEI